MFGVVVGVVSENSIVIRVHKFFEGLTVVDIGRGGFGIVDEFSFCIGIIVFIGPERFAAFLTAFGGVRFEAFRMFSSFNLVVLLAVGVAIKLASTMLPSLAMRLLSARTAWKDSKSLRLPSTTI